MIFDIEDIPEEGLNLDLLAGKEQLEINQPDCSLLDDIKLRGNLAKIEQDISFSGQLKATLRVACTRCLNLFPYNIEAEIKIHFTPLSKKHSPGSEIEIKETEIEQEIYDGGKVDLRGAVRDQILLEVPFMHLCRGDCKGICSECGIDLNSNHCGCQNEGQIDPRFAVLKEIKDKLK
tara:strand:+ start:1618 stop:2148 length:531 start_codon:yes stop_codon:yes gene_type:complete